MDQAGLRYESEIRRSVTVINDYPSVCFECFYQLNAIPGHHVIFIMVCYDIYECDTVRISLYPVFFHVVHLGSTVVSHLSPVQWSGKDRADVFFCKGDLFCKDGVLGLHSF